MSSTILFTWRRYTPPFLIGGAEVSQALLASQLAQAGWNVVYVGSHEPPWDGPSMFDEFADQLRRWSIDVDLNYRSQTLTYSWRGVHCISTPQAAVEPLLRKIAENECAALITSQEGSANLAQIAARSTSVIGWVHSISDTGQEVLHADPSYALLTSRFVRSRMVLDRHTEPVLFYPPFSIPVPSSSARTRDILVVNPVPAKGGSLVRELAILRPDRNFTLVEGWWDTRAEFRDLPNVTYLARTYEMDQLYATHQLLLVPSIVEDAFPRVIVEGALNGLPHHRSLEVDTSEQGRTHRFSFVQLDCGVLSRAATAGGTLLHSLGDSARNVNFPPVNSTWNLLAPVMNSRYKREWCARQTRTIVGNRTFEALVSGG